MRGRIWLSHFTRVAGDKYKEFFEQHPNETRFKFSEWTEVMRDIMDGVAQRINCRIIRRRSSKEEGYSGEYLNIDAFL